MSHHESLPGNRFTDAEHLSELADVTATIFIQTAVRDGEPGAGLLEHTGGGYQFLSSEILGDPALKVVKRLRSSAITIFRTYASVDYWLEHHHDLNAASDATSESILSATTELGELAKIENDFMIESSQQAQRLAREALDDSADGAVNWPAMMRARAVFSHELEVLTENNLEREARLSEMARLSDQIVPAMLEHTIEAVLKRLRSSPTGSQRMQQLQDAALLQQDYEFYVSMFRQTVARNPGRFPLQPFKVVVRGLNRLTTLPNGSVVPRDPIFRRNCLDAAQNLERVENLFLDTLLDEGADFHIITPYNESPPAYMSFRRARQAILAASNFAMTQILETFIEQTRP